MSAVASR